MSDFETIARPYSKALFEMALESKSLQAWSDSLTAAAAIADDEAMQAMFELSSMLPSEHVECCYRYMPVSTAFKKQTRSLKTFSAYWLKMVD